MSQLRTKRTRSRSTPTSTRKSSTSSSNDERKDSPILGISTLRTVQDLLQKNFEVCGNFKVINGIGDKKYLQIDTDKTTDVSSKVSKTKNKPFRHFCQHKVYSKHIWHTHPTVAKPYPSAEDILKIVKTRQNRDHLHTSVIFTDWGIWVLCSVKKSQQMSRVLMAKLREPGNILHNITTDGIPVKKLMKHIKCYISSVEAIIKADCDAVVKIKFHQWGGRGFRI